VAGDAFRIGVGRLAVCRNLDLGMCEAGCKRADYTILRIAGK
jgi:hypothetical protein